MIQRKKPLRQKTPLKRSAIKKPSYEEALAKAKAKQAETREIYVEGHTRTIKGSATPKKPTVAKLKKKADTAFSTYIRLRDAEYRGGSWWCQCCTCGAWKPIKAMQAGHFQSRRFMNTRYHEKNVHAQCPKCNIFNQGEQYKYSLFVNRKYGPGTATMLEKLSQVTKQFKTWELEDMITQYQAAIKEYERKQHNDTLS